MPAKDLPTYPKELQRKNWAKPKALFLGIKLLLAAEKSAFETLHGKIGKQMDVCEKHYAELAKAVKDPKTTGKIKDLKVKAAAIDTGTELKKLAVLATEAVNKWGQKLNPVPDKVWDYASAVVNVANRLAGEVKKLS